MKLLFLSNNLMNPEIQKKAKLPLEFLTFGIVGGKMLTYRGGKNTFINTEYGTIGNSVIYGALYVLKDDYFHMRTIDAMHNCSLSALGVNHKFDMEHRVRRKIRPINFKSIEDLSKLLYTELEPIEADLYISNIHHPRIRQRLERTQHMNFRVKDGINKEAFLKQWQNLK